MQTTLGFYQAPRQYFNKYTIIRPPRDLSLSFPSPEKLNKKKSKEFGFSTCSFKPYESNNQTDEKSFEDPAILISESDESQIEESIRQDIKITNIYQKAKLLKAPKASQVPIF